MKTSDKHLRLYQLWKNSLFNKLESKQFAQSSDSGRVSYDSDKATIAESKKLNKKLITVFKYLKVDPFKPNWVLEEASDGLPETRFIANIHIQPAVIEKLISAFQINQVVIKDSLDRIAFAKWSNGRGPTRAIPPFLAKWLLIGFEVQKGSIPGTVQMLNFLERNSDFEKWLATRRAGKTAIETLLYARGDKDDSITARDKMLNYLTKVVVSSGKKQIVKSLSTPEVKPLVKKLRTEVQMHANEIMSALELRANALYSNSS